MRILFLCLACLPGLPRAAFRYFDPADSAAVPKKLSATGFFTDMRAKTPVPEAAFFEVNAALWSDGAWKQRWILLPPGKSIPYQDTTDLFAYPESTLFVKNFWLESREGDTTSRVLWETRFLMKRSDGGDSNHWIGLSYRWNAAQDEAQLVDPFGESDTLFRYTDAHGRLTYKRWRFPTSSCTVCHRMGMGVDAAGAMLAGRSVLGFYPAQLKRPLPGLPARDQVSELFRRGIFSGTPPDSAALARRYMGIHEDAGATLPGRQPWDILDLKARSYLAANCSGCHGYRGMGTGAINAIKVNFDFYRFTPAIAFAHFPTGSFSLNDTTAFLPTQEPTGRAAFIEAVVRSGLDTSAGAAWDMALPPHTGSPRKTLTPALLYPGYPSLTEMLYRQMRRATAWQDSAKLFRSLSKSAAGGNAAAAAELTWLFKEAWGSRPWEDTLARHGWTLDSVFAAAGQFANGHYYWSTLPDQMPLLGSFMPDTAALTVLAEWVKGYPSTTGTMRRPPAAMASPRILGRTLWVPGGGNDPISVSDLRGRKVALIPNGLGGYGLPESMQAGIYVFRLGARSYRFVLFQAGR